MDYCTRYRTCLLISALLLVVSGCSASAPLYDPIRLENRQSYIQSAATAPLELQASLFKEDQAAISNESLATILSSKVTLPPKAKLIAVRFGQLPYWWGWSEEFAKPNQQIDNDFLSKLASSPRLRDALYLPSLVTPKEMTLPQLRASAARMQADLLLVFRTANRSYDRQKWFEPGEVRAYCTVESVLVDVRSGIITYSDSVTEQFSATRSDRDANFDETIAKANQQAIAKAWLRLAEDVNAYLSKQE
jgi:hypothetical protein